MNRKKEQSNLEKRRVRALITYLAPFRIVENDDTAEAWSATIEQVNKQEWDYVGLHELVGGIDVGLAPPYHMVVGRDGALALPPISELQNDQAAVEFLNRCLAALLLGGVYCEAITLDSLDLGCIIDWKYIRSWNHGTSASNTFHRHIRYKNASALEAINLYKPRVIRMGELVAAMKVGLSTLEQLDPVRGEYLLKGATGLARRDWGSALTNLWIVTEQLLERLWQREVVNPVRAMQGSKSRRSQLEDYRTWTSATRLEMLHQKGVIDLDTLEILSKARKARNDLAHRGEHPTEGDANACLSGLRKLIEAVLGNRALPFLSLDLSNHSISDPFAPPKRIGPIEPEFWMEIPKLPGELELEKAEAAVRSKRREKTGRAVRSSRSKSKDNTRDG